MGSKKIIMLVGSILIGAVAGFALLGYVQGVEDDVESRVARVPVFVLAADVPAGTTASTVRTTNRIIEREIESSFKPASAISDLSQIEGRVAVANLAANQVLVTGMFEDPEVVETTYSDLLADNHVAFSMSIPQGNAVNGFIEPGDFVDMIVLGSPPASNAPGDGDAFEESVVESPYTRPARYLYRGVRIVSINDDVAGQVAAPTPDGAAPPADDGGPTAGTLNVTLAVPPGAAQRILSVEPGSIVFSLLPKGWEPTAQANEVLEELLIDSDLPGEDPSLITPFGPEGFIDELADQAEAEDPDTAFGSTDPAGTTEGDAAGDDSAALDDGDTADGASE